MYVCAYIHIYIYIYILIIITRFSTVGNRLAREPLLARLSVLRARRCRTRGRREFGKLAAVYRIPKVGGWVDG